METLQFVKCTSQAMNNFFGIYNTKLNFKPPLAGVQPSHYKTV